LINNHLGLSLPELKEIIANERIVAQFQSILSARNHSIIGFEGLIRGKTQDGSMIPPVILFDAAREHGLTLELDRLCREIVLTNFENLYHLQNNSLLFLNIETSFLSSKVVGSRYLLNQIERHKIPLVNIVLEIVESKTADTLSLLSFVRAYRECGLNIALDDVGTGHSNFDRISLIRPNIIKVDRSIISGMATNYFKQQIFKSLSNLSKNIGCLTLAEGVETEEEVIHCIEYGADLMQGYFFSRPKDIIPRESNEEEQKMDDLLLAFRMQQIDVVKARRLQNKRYQKIVQGIVKKIQGKSMKEIHALLKDIIDLSDTIDALYIIDARSAGGYIFAVTGHFLELSHNVIQLFFVNYITDFFNIIPDSMTAGMLPEDEPALRYAYRLGCHDFVSSFIFKQAILMYARFMGKSIGSHDSLVGLNRNSGDFRQELGRLVYLLRFDPHLHAEMVVSCL
jgi:EAL domain-containing protein (putative c-di-GMP-specific phosphodiesterase class I)